MEKTVFDSCSLDEIEALRIDGMMVGSIEEISRITVNVSSGLWEISFSDGAKIYSTGNVFICLKPKPKG